MQAVYFESERDWNEDGRDGVRQDYRQASPLFPTASRREREPSVRLARRGNARDLASLETLAPTTPLTAPLTVTRET